MYVVCVCVCVLIYDSYVVCVCVCVLYDVQVCGLAVGSYDVLSGTSVEPGITAARVLDHQRTLRAQIPVTVDTSLTCDPELRLVRRLPGDGCPGRCDGEAGKLHGDSWASVGDGGGACGDAGRICNDNDGCRDDGD